MNMLRMMVLVALFVFVAFFFPEMRSACANATGDLAPVIHQMPLVLLVSTLVLPFYYAWSERDN